MIETSNWNPQRLEMLARLWERGDTATQIGAALGISRSAVLAKARRLGLTRKDGDEARRFERLVDYVADAPVDAPVSIARAAIRVGIPMIRAEALWREMARGLGIDDKELSDRLERRIGTR